MNKFDKIDELKEIERKFKVNVTLMGFIGEIIPKKIVQGYIYSTPSLSTRVRRMDDKAYLTIKGGLDLLSRDEFEYEIPVVDANEMLALFCKKILKKKRYVLVQDELCWEIDVFEGKLEGLILAEIELPAVDTPFSLPDWIGEEVTEDPQYLNANLLERC